MNDGAGVSYVGLVADWREVMPYLVNGLGLADGLRERGAAVA